MKHPHMQGVNRAPDHGLCHSIHTGKDMLTPNERTVLQLRFGLGTDDASSGLTLVEIARQLSISTQRASQLEASALSKMRAAMRERGIESLEDVL
jgi:DNA-directed RNA polymerase sigma subunit (sigma70/sigma32)